MHSMTGYGKGTAAANGKTVTVELKTVNHKFFDWSMKMPKGFLFLEDSAKKTVAGKVARGHIDVFVGYDCESGAVTEYRVDKELAAKFAAAAREVADAAGVECDLSVSDLVRNADILSAPPRRRTRRSSADCLQPRSTQRSTGLSPCAKGRAKASGRTSRPSSIPCVRTSTA